MSRRKVTYLYLLIVISLLVGNVFVAVYGSTKGVELVTLEKEVDNLEKQNREMEQKFVSLSSLTSMGEIAQKLELVAPEKIIYINTSGLVANANGNKI